MRSRWVLSFYLLIYIIGTCTHSRTLYYACNAVDCTGNPDVC